VDLNILLFNNEIYGLTKGQYSPTSRIGTTSPSSPGGSVDTPVRPGAFAVGAGATFIARGIDIDQKGLPGILTAARAHRGAAFVEILQNCIVYNKDVFESVSSRKTAADHQIRVEHGQPLLYGPNQDKGLRLNPKTLQLEAIQVGAQGADEVLIHDETNPNLALMLLNLAPPMPTAIGVIHRRQTEPFEQAFWNAKPRERRQRVVTLLHQGNLVDHR
ncbi:MAG: thiamine pyrophosphate-dependent enzyme, partial [Gammaproteobacteria bacterium]|nr:thiamine pyrophosphate-dependent enzyme [Gammaproteobacteria bacterium]